MNVSHAILAVLLYLIVIIYSGHCQIVNDRSFFLFSRYTVDSFSHSCIVVTSCVHLYFPLRGEGMCLMNVNGSSMSAVSQKGHIRGNDGTD